MVNACPIIRDELETVPRLGQQPRINLVGNRRHQHITGLDRLAQLLAAHRCVLFAQPHIEQLRQPLLDDIGQPSRDYNTQLLF